MQVADGVVPQRKPCVCPGPVAGQVQDGLALRAGQAGGNIDDLAPQRRSACPGVLVSGEHAGSAQQVVGNRGAQHPGRVGPEPARRDVRQRSVDQIGEHRFDDRVLAVGDVGLLDGQLGVGEERVIPPHREQRIGNRASLTRRTTRRAVIRSGVDAKAV